MNFVNAALRQLEAPDPLWLYKVGTSLIHQKAAERALVSGHDAWLEAHVLVEEIKHALRDPSKMQFRETGLEPIIGAIEAVAKESNRVFHLFQNESRGVAEAVLDHYQKSSVLVHLNRTGKITDAELNQGAMLLISEFDRYGANGLHRMWDSWNSGTRDMLKQLSEHKGEIIPSKVQGNNNSRNRPYTRSDYFRGEMEHYAPKTDEAYQDILWKLIPRTIGPDFEKAIAAKEALIARHIRSGITKWGSKNDILLAALHRNSERAQNAAVQHFKTPAFNFVDQSLNLTPQELENIRVGNWPKTVNECLDQDLGANYPNHSQIIDSLRSADYVREAVPSISQATPLLESTSSPEPTTPFEEHLPETKQIIPDHNEKPNNEKKSNSRHGFVLAGKVGGTVLGSILIADQFHRASKKDNSDKEEKKSKVVNYVIATAAATSTGLVVFTKPEKLVKFVDDIRQFLKVSPSKA